MILILAMHGVPAVLTAAESASAGALPSPARADMEAASAGAAMPSPGRLARTFRLTLTLDASPTNHAEVVLASEMRNEELGIRNPDPDTTALIIGWSRGSWFIRGDGLKKRFSSPAANPSAEGLRTLTVKVRLDAEGAPVGVALAEEGAGGRAAVIFGGTDASATILSWLDTSNWASFGVTSRGTADVSAVASTAIYYADGTTLILR